MRCLHEPGHMALPSAMTGRGGTGGGDVLRFKAWRRMLWLEATTSTKSNVYAHIMSTTNMRGSRGGRRVDVGEVDVDCDDRDDDTKKENDDETKT